MDDRNVSLLLNRTGVFCRIYWICAEASPRLRERGLRQPDSAANGAAKFDPLSEPYNQACSGSPFALRLSGRMDRKKRSRKRTSSTPRLKRASVQARCPGGWSGMQGKTGGQSRARKARPEKLSGTSRAATCMISTPGAGSHSSNRVPTHESYPPNFLRICSRPTSAILLSFLRF
jgi:hypothetical protein